jgi:hypothetical protein
MNKSVNKTLDTSKIKNKSDISEIVNYPKTHRKHESSTISNNSNNNNVTNNFIPKNLDPIHKTIASRGSSHDRTKTQSQSNQTKTIHALKDVGVGKISGLNSNKNKESLTPNNYTSNNSKVNNSSNNSNIILNQNGIPCFNNIHIYTNGLNGINGIKTNDINLRQFILNKVNVSKNKSSSNKGGNNKSHGRCNSVAGQ